MGPGPTISAHRTSERQPSGTGTTMHMKALPLVAAALVALAGTPAPAQVPATVSTRTAAAPTDARADLDAASSAELVTLIAEARFSGDLEAMQEFRPGYAFWQHIFRIPDGSVAFGSAADGRLLAVFPARGDW